MGFSPQHNYTASLLSGYYYFLFKSKQTETQVRSTVRIIISPLKRLTELKQILQRSTLALFFFVCLFLLFLFANNLWKVLTINVSISFQHHLDSTLQKQKPQILQVPGQLCKNLFKLLIDAFNFQHLISIAFGALVYETKKHLQCFANPLSEQNISFILDHQFPRRD